MTWRALSPGVARTTAGVARNIRMTYLEVQVQSARDGAHVDRQHDEVGEDAGG
jgi:hypothetical protein